MGERRYDAILQRNFLNLDKQTWLTNAFTPCCPAARHIFVSLVPFSRLTGPDKAGNHSSRAGQCRIARR